MKQNTNIVKENNQLVDNVKNKIKYLRHYNQPYIYTISGSTHKLENKLMKDVFNTNKLKADDLAFISLVRKDILSSKKILDLDTVYCRASDVTYFFVNNHKQDTIINNVCEIDIDRAYWDSAYILGYLSKNVWEQGCERNKVLRLMSLGSFAKKKYTFIYNPNEKNKAQREKLYPEYNPYQYVWFNISKYVSDCMLEIKKSIKDSLIFFWVDAAFMENTDANKQIAIDIIEKYGFGYKMIDIKNVSYKKSGEILVRDVKHEDDRIFNTPSKNSVIKLISELNYHSYESTYSFE